MGQAAVQPWRQALSAGQWCDIQYETLVADPVAQLQHICEFLGESYTDEMLTFHTTPIAKRRGQTKDNWALAEPISTKHVGLYKEQLSLREQRIMSWVAGDSLRAYGYDNILEPLALSPEQVSLYDELDGRYRAATLDAPGGWIVMESYNDWLQEQRLARRQAGLWSELPEPAPFPIGHRHQEYLSGMRASSRWKSHFSIKREYSRAKAVL